MLANAGLGIVIAIVVLGVIGAGLAQGMKTRKAAAARVEAAGMWMAAPGRILSASLGVESREYIDSDPDNTTSDTYWDYYFPDVVYEYSLGATLFRGNVVHVSDTPLGRQPNDRRAKEVLARYPVGATVTVFFDPANPQQCCLER